METQTLAGEDNGAFFPPRYFPAAGEGALRPVSLGASAGKPFSQGAAWLTLEALTQVVRPGEEAVWQEYAGSRRIAWKTGTSFGSRDAWAIGVNGEWTVAVWIGNATGEGRAELRSANTAAPVLFELFSALDSYYGLRRAGGTDKPNAASGSWFPQPEAVLKIQDVCAYSGFAPGPSCSLLKATLLPKDAPPHKPCPYCRSLTLNEAGDRQVLLAGGSVEPVRRENRFALPPAEEWYYRKWNLDYQGLPPRAGEVPPGEADLPLALFNPGEGAQVFIPREIDGREGRVVFSAAHREQNTPIHWHLDGGYLGMTTYFHEMETRPGGGTHTLTLVDRAGNTLTRRFQVLETPDE